MNIINPCRLYVFILCLMVTRAFGESQPIINITLDGYWLGTETYQINSDGSFHAWVITDTKNKTASEIIGSITETRLNFYTSLLGGIGIYDVTQENLKNDRDNKETKISVTDSVTLTIKIKRENGFYEITENAIEAKSTFYSDSENYRKLQNCNLVLHLLRDEIRKYHRQ